MKGERVADTVKGACLCGAVQFEVTLPTLGCCHCHCSICRRFSGAGYATFFHVSRERFRLLAGGENLSYNATVPRRGRSECSARRAGAACSESRMVYRHSGSHSGVCLALSTASPTGTSAGTTVPRGCGSETTFLGSAAQRGRRSLALGTERDDEGEGARGGVGFHSAMTAESLELTCHSIKRGYRH